MGIETHLIKGKTVSIFSAGQGGSLFIMCSFDSGHEDAGNVFKRVCDLKPEASFCMSAFSADDWRRDFSPWRAEPDFAGGGEATLEWLIDSMDDIRAAAGTDGRCYICGYSLAGLFSLWSCFESMKFDGCACCSGSLWYPGLIDYIQNHSLQKESLVYMSLGGKEEKARDSVMAAVGIRTKEAFSLISKMPEVRQSTFEMNAGGHFSNTDKRMAKGIDWLLTNTGKL
ncbi:MAG: hypothetical protein Q4E57_11025 [Eubacteriales bacterium]|nr:hypothetical protein [Eubacteriales bacterium]